MDARLVAALTLALTLGAMVFWWLVSLGTKDASVADRWWGLGILVACLAAWRWTGETGPRFYVFFLVAAWGIRLSAHLYGRSQGRPEDPRYAAWRRQHGGQWWWRSLLQVFLLQGLLMWVIAAPALVVLLVPGGPAFGPLDGLAIAVFVAGLMIEGVADAQLQLWKQKGGRGVLKTGLWRYSRHPNYFGEAVVWWGIWIAAAAHGAWWTATGPVLITFLLLRVSGVPMLEEHLRTKGRPYAEYVRRTSAFIPMPPRK